MRFFTIACAAAAFLATLGAAPIKPRATMSSPDTASTLNYALTLEHLEAEFYKQGLAKFDVAAFTGAGFDAKVRDRLVHIGEHENDHVSMLTSVITSMSGQPVPVCEYNFPMDNLTQFLAIAQALENTGVSAYLGAIKGLDGDLLTAAAAITTVEARHAAYLNELWGQMGYPYALDTVLSPQQIVTIATSFISKCPYDLGVKSFNHLSATLPSADSTMVATSFTGDSADKTDSTWCQFLYGTKTSVSPRRDCKLPDDAIGYVYVLVTSSDEPVTTANQQNILAGPALLFNGTHIH
ncbi:ferritin-like domain-containing protein [Mortierella sp. GBAus27b]|nr:ferritin-like domain-containing protein [Mortierella sp. GBAus27b]